MDLVDVVALYSFAELIDPSDWTPSKKKKMYFWKILEPKRTKKEGLGTKNSGILL